jgi:hypothetical protein
VTRWDYAPHAHSRVSNINLIFENKLWKGGVYKYSMKNISRTAKFLPILGYVKGIVRVFI